MDQIETGKTVRVTFANGETVEGPVERADYIRSDDGSTFARLFGPKVGVKYTVKCKCCTHRVEVRHYGEIEVIDDCS